MVCPGLEDERERKDYKGVERRDYCEFSHSIARAAVKEVFATLGVNVDVPIEVENFRKDLRFAQELRTFARGGILAAITAFVSLVVGVIVYAFKDP